MNQHLLKYKEKFIKFLSDDRKMSDSSLAQHKHSLNIFYKFLGNYKIKTLDWFLILIFMRYSIPLVEEAKQKVEQMIEKSI